MRSRRPAWFRAASRGRDHFVIASLLVSLAACTRASVHPASYAGAAGAEGRASARGIKADIVFLASDRLEGRGSGTPGNDSAAAYIARRFAALRLPPGGAGYLQPFIARPLPEAHEAQPVRLPTQNVVAILPGSDPLLRGQYVVVGAHYDHLGRSTQGALDPGNRNAIRNGADDNASGTAAVLELARLFSRAPARRSIVFVAFSSEELGLLGSQYFVEHSPVPIDSVVAMINFDMVGRLRDDKLIVYGVSTATELPALLDSANTGASGRRGGSPWESPLRITALGDGFGPSDHSSFFARNIPVLHFFTDLHDDYHRASDDADKVNAEGEAHVVDVAKGVVRAIADRATRLTFVRSATPPRTVAGSRRGSDVYLGSIPDMGASDVGGLRLTGVSPGSPAEQAGLAAGDVIVEFGGKSISNLVEFSEALYSHKPGDEVSVTVLRGGERREFRVKLTRRG